MDMGVGAFVFGRGLVSRGKAPSLLSSVPMIVLGFVRLAMVKGGEYQALATHPCTYLCMRSVMHECHQNSHGVHALLCRTTAAIPMPLWSGARLRIWGALELLLHDGSSELTAGPSSAPGPRRVHGGPSNLVPCTEAVVHLPPPDGSSCRDTFAW